MTQTPENRIGYISDYPSGIRENGGQYTHAAIWYLMALCRVGRQDEAYELFCMINPAEKCLTHAGTEKYKGEPYVFAGDVYSNKDNSGRCGWSWYTGSAAWFKYTLTEDFFGIKKRGDRLYIKPRLPSAFDRLSVRIAFGAVSIDLFYRRGKDDRIVFRGERRSFVPLDECKDGERIEVEFV